MPATRIRRTPATLALLLAALGVLVGAAPAEASGSSTLGAADCAAASYLTADGHPAEALALVRAVREAEVAAGDDPAAKALAAAACSATFVSAVEAICLEARERNDRGEFAEAVTLITGVRDPAIEAVGAGSASRSERRATRACEAELDDATEGVEATTWSDDTGSAWQTFVDDWIAPLQPLGLWIGGVFIGAIVAARLLVLVISRYPRWTPAVMRGMWLGMIPSLLGAALLVLGLSPTDHPPLRNWVLVTLGVVLLLVGTVATAFFFGGRLRLSVVYSGKSEDPAAAAEIISKLVLLGGGRLRGVEIAGAPDIKALDGETFSSVISDTTLKAVFTAVKEIFGSIPWVVTIHEIAGADDGPPDGHVVSVSRNGRSSVSQVVETGRLRFQALGEAGPLGPPWFIASVILVAFARSYRGFGGIDAHSDWRSLGLGVVARELFANKDAEARSLTSLAVRIDARNDVAAYNYMYFSFRHHPDLVGTMRYAAWLRADLDDPGWRVGRQQWSVALMALRKQTNYVSVERNLIALSGVPRPAQPPASAWVVTTSGHLLAAPAVLMALAASPSRRRHPKPGGGRRDEEALACHARLALETNNLILRRLSAPQEDPVLAEMRYRAAVAAWVLHAWSPNTSIAATREWVLEVIAEAERSTSAGVAYSTLCRWAVTGKITATSPPPSTGRVVIDSPCTTDARETAGLDDPTAPVTASELEEKLRILLDSRYIVIALGDKKTMREAETPPPTKRGIAALDRVDWLANDPELAGIQNNPVLKSTVGPYVEAARARLLAQATKAASEASEQKKTAKDAKPEPAPKTTAGPSRGGSTIKAVSAVARVARDDASGREMTSDLPD